MKLRFERAIASKRFKMRVLITEIMPLFLGLVGMQQAHSTLFRLLETRHLTYLLNAVIRNVFLIELVKTPKIDSTKFQVRWCSELHSDPRGCAFEECLDIARDLMNNLANGWLDSEEHQEALKLFKEFGLLPYEGPFDYISRPQPSDSQTRIHARQNVALICDEAMLRTLRLRKFLLSPTTSPDARFFYAVLNDKVKIKTYLTDRVLTGTYKTNREKRWEVHPYSVHFATRRAAMAIEHTLITQLCSFDGFPSDSRKRLEDEGMLSPGAEVYRCPITLDPLSFLDFKEELSNPSHGKSKFQVGHMNPLKLDDTLADASGHTARNVSWVSSDGNRIQGSMSLSEVRTLLRRVVRNFEETGLV